MSGGSSGGGQSSAPTAQNQTVSNIAPWAQPGVEQIIQAGMKNVFPNQTTNPDGSVNLGAQSGYTPFNAQAGYQNPNSAAGQALSAAESTTAAPSYLQNQSYQGAANLQVPGQYGAASNVTGMGIMGSMNAGNQYNRMATNPYAVGAFMNPYLQQSLAPQLALLNQQYGMQNVADQARATQQGAFGGGRTDVQHALTQQAQDLASQQAIAQGYNQAFNQAQQAQQFGANLGLQGYGQAMTGANQLANIGGQQLQAQQGILSTQNQLGTQQQQQQQAMLDKAAQQYTQMQNYPMNQLGQLESLYTGAPQNISTLQYQAPPSTVSQLAGLGTAGLAGYKLANMAEGGIAKVKKFDVGGSVENKLYELPTAQLQEELNTTSSPTIKEIGNKILAERKLEGSTFAPGGIIAFADGGDTDDDDESYEEAVQKAQMDAALSRHLNLKASLAAQPDDRAAFGVYPQMPQGGVPAQQAQPQQLQQSQQPQQLQQSQQPQQTSTGDGSNLSTSANFTGDVSKTPKGYNRHPFHDAAVKVAKEMGVDPQKMLHILYHETGNMKDPVHAVSPVGAKGITQFMPATAKQYNVNPDDPMSSLYGTAKYLLNSEKVLGNNPALEYASYNSGLGNVLKAKGVPNFKETQGYVTPLVFNEGGIASFDGGGGVSYYDPMGNQSGNVAEEEDYSNSAIPKLAAWERTKNAISGLGFKTNEDLQKNASITPKITVPKQDAYLDSEAARKRIVTPAPTSITTPTPTLVNPPGGDRDFDMSTDDSSASKQTDQTQTSAVDDMYENYLKNKMSQLGKDKEEDKWMALLNAGFGMMGSKSPYALQGIGEGGQAGIAAALAAKKQRGTEEAALMKGMYNQQLLNQYYKPMADVKSILAEQKAEANKSIDYHKTIAEGLRRELNQIASKKNELNEQRTSAVLEAQKRAEDAKVIANINKDFKNWSDSALLNDPEYADLAKKARKGTPEDKAAVKAYRDNVLKSLYAQYGVKMDGVPSSNKVIKLD